MTSTALITGGTGLLGRAMVAGFLKEGWNVVTTSRRSPADVFALFPEWAGRHSVRCYVTQVDFEMENSFGCIEDYLLQEGLFPHALINNTRNIEHLTLDDNGRPPRDRWIAQFELEVRVSYELALLLARMPGGQLNSVVNVSSVYGIVAANPSLYSDFQKQSPVHYGVSKAALNHLTKELAVRLAENGVRVNAVSYGGVEGRADQAFKERYATMCPLGRMLRPGEVVGPALFLASDSSAGMTGHNLVVDGGWSIW